MDKKSITRNRADIDEIQRAPRRTVSETQVVDEGRLQVMLAGSSRIGLLDCSADRLAGKIQITQLSNIENIEGLLAILFHAVRLLGSDLELSNFAKEFGLSPPSGEECTPLLILQC